MHSYYNCNSTYRLRYWNDTIKYCKYHKNHFIAIVLTACGIETFLSSHLFHFFFIAIVLTACGIETRPSLNSFFEYREFSIAIVLTACGIETLNEKYPMNEIQLYCNSTYRLRYWNATEVPKLLDAITADCNSTYRLRYWNGIIMIFIFFL